MLRQPTQHGLDIGDVVLHSLSITKGHDLFLLGSNWALENNKVDTINDLTYPSHLLDISIDIHARDVARY
jgi:hypothetical protein